MEGDCKPYRSPYIYAILGVSSKSGVFCPSRCTEHPRRSLELGVATDSADSGSADVIELVPLQGFDGRLLLDLAAAGQLLEHGHHDRLRRRCGRSAGRRRGCRRSRTRRRRVRCSRPAPTARSGRARPACSPTRRRPGRRPRPARGSRTAPAASSAGAQQIRCFAFDRVAAQLVPRRHRPHVDVDVPLLAEHPLRVQRPRHADPGGEHLRPRPAVDAERGGVAVDARAAARRRRDRPARPAARSARCRWSGSRRRRARSAAR